MSKLHQNKLGLPSRTPDPVPDPGPCPRPRTLSQTLDPVPDPVPDHAPDPGFCPPRPWTLSWILSLTLDLVLDPVWCGSLPARPHQVRPFAPHSNNNSTTSTSAAEGGACVSSFTNLSSTVATGRHGTHVFVTAPCWAEAAHLRRQTMQPCWVQPLEAITEHQCPPPPLPPPKANVQRATHAARLPRHA